jgi:hypothetical protein
MRDAHGEIAGRETEVLDALKIEWRKACNGKHIHCPFPGHDDKHPSWRWDAKDVRWKCTCGVGSVFDAAIAMGQAADWKGALAWVRKVLAVENEEVAELVYFTAGAGASPFIEEPGVSGGPGAKAEPEPQEAAAAQHVLADRQPTATQVTHAKFGKPTRIDCYMVGARVYEARVRYDTEQGKAVLPWHYNGKRWVNSAAPQPRPLYRLAELWLDPDAPILVVEGEKAVDGAADRFADYVVTTTSGGCKQAHHTDYAAFAGRRVVVWPDNDEPGRKYAEAICALVMAAGAIEARIVQVPPDWPKGWDLADELPPLTDAFSYTEEMLRVMLNDAVDWVPPVEPEAAKPAFTVDVDVANEVEQEFEFDPKGNIRRNEHNVCAALARMGVKLSYDEFSAKYMIEGLKGYGPIVNDDALDELWLCLQRQFYLRLGKEELDRIILSQGRMRRFHPVRQYLESVTWDGVARVDRWLATYFGVEDDSAGLTRAIGKILLVAAVRRVRQPGVKYEHLVVLEGPQGVGKSRAVKALCPNPHWFTDSISLGLEPREVMELTAGKWIVEIGELAGMRKSEVEHVKALLSRQTDEARMAYDRMKRDRPREWICIGTTNEDTYLLDETGNRRFLPVTCGRINVAGIERDRDQLWAEACVMEAKGEPIFLSDELRGALANQHASREVIDELQEVVQEWLDKQFRPGTHLFEDHRTTIVEVARSALELKTERLDPGMQRRIRRILKHAGWKKGMRSNGKNYWVRSQCITAALKPTECTG